MKKLEYTKKKVGNMNDFTEDIRVEVPGYTYTNFKGKLVTVPGYSYIRGEGGKKLDKQPLEPKPEPPPKPKPEPPKEPIHLTGAQLVMFDKIKKAGHSLSKKEIDEMSIVSPRTVAAHLEDLMNRGLITRTKEGNKYVYNTTPKAFEVATKDPTGIFDARVAKLVQWDYNKTVPTGFRATWTAREYADFMTRETEQPVDLKGLEGWLEKQFGYSSTVENGVKKFYRTDRLQHYYLSKEKYAEVEKDMDQPLHPAIKIEAEGYSKKWHKRINMFNNTLISLKEHARGMKGAIYTERINDHSEIRSSGNAAGIYMPSRHEIYVSQKESSYWYLKEVTVHEAAHSFHLGRNMTTQEMKTVTSLYNKYKEQVKENRYSYASKNEREFFAEAYTAIVLPNSKSGFFKKMPDARAFFKGLIEKYDFEVLT